MEHVFPALELLDRIVAAIQLSWLCRRLQDIASQQSRTHWSQSLVEKSKETVLGPGALQVLDQFEGNDAGEIDHHRSF